KADRPTFLNFVATGMQKGWDSAANEFYGFRNVDDLEGQWIDHLKRVARGEGEEVAVGGRRPAPPSAGAKRGVFVSTPPARPSVARRPSAGETAAAGRDGERFGGDIGWTRPRARLAEPVSAEVAMREESRTSSRPGGRPYTPSAVLLPPEPAPQR